MPLQSEQKKQFQIFSLFPNMDFNTEVKAELTKGQYSCNFFLDPDSLLSRLSEVIPHIIVFSVDSLQGPLSEFVEKVFEFSADIQFVCIAPLLQGKDLYAYQEYNFRHFISQNENIGIRVLWAVDQICDYLYLQYQNEFLLEKKNEQESLIESAKQQLKQKDEEVIFAKQELVQQNIELKQEIEVIRQNTVFELESADYYKNANSKEEMINLFFKYVADSETKFKGPLSVIFFKYIPQVASLIPSLASGMALEEVSSKSYKLSEEELHSIEKQKGEQTVSQNLLSHFRQLRPDRQVANWWLFVGQEIEGLFVFYYQAEFNFSRLKKDFAYFEVCYEKIHLQKMLLQVDAVDSVTGLQGGDFFHKRVKEEMSRAQRLRSPLSLIRISLDHIQELEQSMGLQNKNLILQALAQLIKKTSRVNDFVCRTQENEISVILPHCGRRGASLRAERLRKTVETQFVTQKGVHLTISCGVSEYPSLSNSEDELLTSSVKALTYVFSKGGNKVCLFKPSADFKPEFEVPV